VVINENIKRKIIPIASGKGGVGKSLLVANLSIELANKGFRTIAIDLDLGGSNLHTFLGLKNTNSGIGNFLSNNKITFDDITIETPYENLLFIPGDVLVSGLANIEFSQKKKIISNILKLDADYIIIDLGSGSNFNVIDFFLISNSGFIVVTNQIISILNAYHFFKNLVFRFLQGIFSNNKEVLRYLRNISKEKAPNSFTSISNIIGSIDKIDHNAARKAKKCINSLHPKIVVNMAESPDDLYIIEKLKDLIYKNLNIDVECMGFIYFDNGIQKSISELTPLVSYDRDTIASKVIERIALKIIQSKRFPEMPLDLSYYKDTFELTQIEAQNDYEKLITCEKPLSGIDVGKLLAITSAQKEKIKELSDTIRMLTMRTQ